MRKNSQETYPFLVYRSVILFPLLCVVLQSPATQAQDVTKPDLSKPWGSEYGIIYWNKGYYANSSKTLRGSLSKNSQDQWVYKGTWGRTNNDKHGELEFTFDTPYSFKGKFKNISGEWDKKSWNGGTIPKAKTQAKSTIVKAAKRSCIPEMKEYRKKWILVNNFADKLKKIKHLQPPPEMPDVEFCIKGDKAIVKPSGLAMETVEFTTEILSIFGGGGTLTGEFKAILGSSAAAVGPALYFINGFLKSFASRNDEEMSTTKALKIYQEYMEHKRGFSRKAMIKLHSCALLKMEHKLNQAMWQLSDAKNAATTRIHYEKSCLPEEEGKWPISKLDNAYYEELAPKVKHARTLKSNFRPVACDVGNFDRGRSPNLKPLLWMFGNSQKKK